MEIEYPTMQHPIAYNQLETITREVSDAEVIAEENFPVPETITPGNN